MTNPVSLFATDNNGVIIELPTVSGGEEASVSGSLVFGIGTQSNNALGGATVYTADRVPETSRPHITERLYSDSFIDSGSNGYFFATSITACPSTSNAPGFYCPHQRTESFGDQSGSEWRQRHGQFQHCEC